MNKQPEKCCKKCLDAELTGHDICAFKHCECHPEGRSSSPVVSDWEKEFRDFFGDEFDRFDFCSAFECTTSVTKIRAFIRNVRNQTLEQAAEAVEKTKRDHKPYCEVDTNCCTCYTRIINPTLSEAITTIRSLKS